MSILEEESNFLRFYFLNLKIVSRAVRVYFDSVHSPPGLASELANSYGTLKGLRFITKSQLQKLYPSPCKLEIDQKRICNTSIFQPHDYKTKYFKIDLNSKVN